MADTGDTAELDQLRQEVATLRAQSDEAEALVGALRQRTIVLNNEVRYRDGVIAERDATIASLVQQLNDAELAGRAGDE